MRKTLMLAPLALAFLAAPALAYEKGDWAFSLGAHVVAPTSGNGSLAGGALDADGARHDPPCPHARPCLHARPLRLPRRPRR